MRVMVIMAEPCGAVVELVTTLACHIEGQKSKVAQPEMELAEFACEVGLGRK